MADPTDNSKPPPKVKLHVPIHADGTPMTEREFETMRIQAVLDRTHLVKPLNNARKQLHNFEVELAEKPVYHEGMKALMQQDLQQWHEENPAARQALYDEELKRLHTAPLGQLHSSEAFKTLPREIREEAYAYIKEGSFPLDMLSDTKEPGASQSDRQRYKTLATQCTHDYDNMRDGVTDVFSGKAYPYRLPMDYEPLDRNASAEEQKLNAIGLNNRMARNEIVEILDNPKLRRLLQDGKLKVEPVLELPEGAPAATPNAATVTANPATPHKPVGPQTKR